MISVCIPTFNGEKYLNKQLDSILPQLEPEDEIIISDDSSSDNTLSIIKSYKDERIKLLMNNDFKSPAFNLENALINAQGDYIFLSDQDDIWMKGKLGRQVKAMLDVEASFGSNFPVLIHSDLAVVDESLELIADSFWQYQHIEKAIQIRMAFNN